MNDGDYIRCVEESCAYLQEKIPYIPQTIIQLGTGLSDFGDNVQHDLCIPYSEIPHFPKATVASHKGNLLFASIQGHPVAILQGRFHFYEGYTTKEVAFPVRVLSLIGCKNLIVTNAAGGLNPLFQPGSIMILRDHLNFLGENPLRGLNNEKWGPRFPDLSEPYSPRLAQIALESSKRLRLSKVITGTYVCIPGPSLETPAETRWLRESGADAVGMSTVPEVLVARHAGMDVLGLSAVSNVNDPDNFVPILLDDILATAAEIGPKLKLLLNDILKNMEVSNSG